MYREVFDRLRAAAEEGAREERRLLRQYGVPANLTAAEAAGWRLWTAEPDGRPEAVALYSAAAVRAGHSGLYVLVEPEL